METLFFQLNIKRKALARKIIPIKGIVESENSRTPLPVKIKIVDTLRIRKTLFSCSIQQY